MSIPIPVSDAVLPSTSAVGDGFCRPLPEYRPIVWWMLNGDLDRTALRRQLEKFKEYGFSGYATYPYRGLTVPYQGEAWWELMRYILEVSAELGLDAWIFDEFNWPSGHCAGYILRDQPWLRSSPLRCVQAPVDVGRNAEVTVDGEVVSVVLVSQGRAVAVDDWRLETLPSETRLIWHNAIQEGLLHIILRAPVRMTYYFAHGAPWSIGPRDGWGIIDLLSKASVATTLRYTAEQYKLRFPQFFGSTIKGIFTDENVVAQFDNLPYTKDLEAEFSRRYGRELRPCIHELFTDTGDYLRTRHDYWRIVADWIGAHYYRPYREWCERNGVRLIGHLCGEEKIDENVRLNGDVFEAGRHFHHPGVDTLYGVTPYDDAAEVRKRAHHYAEDDIRSFHLTMALARSTVKHSGADRMFNEAFTCQDYSVTPQSIKRAANYYAACGVSQLCIADFNYSYAGIRKRRGGSKTFATPWNNGYPQLTDYIARLSAFAATGRPRADIGVLYPRTTVWTRLVSKEDMKRVNRVTYALLDSLARHHWPFDIIYEQLLEKAHVTDGALVLPSESYRVVVAVAAEVMPESVLAKLEEFAAAGGRLIIVPPFAVKSPDASDLEARTASLLQHPNAIVWNLADAAAGDRAMSGDELFGKWLQKPVSVEGRDAEQTVVSCRELADGHLALIANLGNRDSNLQVCPANRGEAELWNLEDGTRTRIERIKGRIGLHLAPAQAVILCVRASDPVKVDVSSSSEVTESASDPLYRQALECSWEFNTHEPNQFRPETQIRYDRKDTGLTEEWYLQPETGEWAPIVDFACSEDIDSKSMPAYWLRADVRLEHVPDDLRLVLDSNLVTHVFINGQRLTGMRPTGLWSQDNLVLELAGRVTRGLNSILLRCRTEALNLERINDVPAIPLVLTGSFQVAANQALVEPAGILAIGSWHRQGFPHFAGTGVYRGTFVWNGPSSPGVRVWLDLGKVGDVATVYLNGRKVGIRLWEPYRFEVMEFLLFNAPNRLEVQIAGGMGNLLPIGYTDQMVPGPVDYGLLRQPFLVAERIDSAIPR